MTTGDTPKIIIIFNPVAGNRRRGLLDRVVELLSDDGWQVSVAGTTGPGNATRLASDAVASGAQVIGAAGGDGTIREVIAGITGAAVPVALIPLGTANVLALELGIGKTAGAVAGIIAAGHRRRLHLPTVNGTPFSLMVGAGFDGEIVHAVSSKLKRRWGRAAFVFQGLRAIARHAPHRVRVTCGDRTQTGIWAIVTNISRYGGPFVLDDRSRPEIPELAAIVFHGPSRIRLCADLVRLGLGQATGSPAATVFRGRVILLESDAPDDCPVQIDGDAVGSLPVRLKTTDSYVEIVVPRP